MQTKLRAARIVRFGCVTGLEFEDGGAVRIVLHGLEIKRIMKALEALESKRTKRNSKVLEALRLLAAKAGSLNVRIVADVPIAARCAKIVPIIR